MTAGRAGLGCLLLIVTAVPAPAQDAADALARARTAYNARAWDEAISAADLASRVPDLATAADLVAARALVERYRESAAPEDLAQARERLRRLDTARLTPRERTEFLIGLGGALYFEESPGAAATLFHSALGATDLDDAAREHLLDWWASALDRDARARTPKERHAIYADIRARMADRLSASPASATAAYWLAAAAVGEEDWDGAWHAALAAWARAPLTADRGAALRADIERLVERAVLPARARHQGRDQAEIAKEWADFKTRWLP
jgi:hypothetical protein